MPQPNSARAQKLAELEQLQQYQAGGAVQDMAFQGQSMKHMLQMYGIRQDQQMQPGRLEGQRLDNEGKALVTDPRIREAELGNINARTRNLDTQTSMYDEAKKSQAFHQEASGLNEVFYPGHPKRDAMMMALMERYYPGMPVPTDAAPPTTGNYADTTHNTTPDPELDGLRKQAAAQQEVKVTEKQKSGRDTEVTRLQRKLGIPTPDMLKPHFEQASATLKYPY